VQRLAVTAAHDLRTPLSGIAGFGALLASTLADQPRSLAMVEQIREGTRSALALVDDLLSYVTACASRAPLEPIDLTGLVEQVAAKQVGARVVVAQLGTVLGDATLLRLLFQHLLSNAVAYVEEDTAPHVEISAGVLADGRREFLVTDNARGIARQLDVHDRRHGPGAGDLH